MASWMRTGEFPRLSALNEQLSDTGSAGPPSTRDAMAGLAARMKIE
jgi:hypothetical protein